jgi:hypothetical protein
MGTAPSLASTPKISKQVGEASGILDQGQGTSKPVHPDFSGWMIAGNIEAVCWLSLILSRRKEKNAYE